MKKNSGFSLVELLISIAIIGILAAIVLSSISNSRTRAYDSEVKQQLTNFRTAAEIYLTNKNNYGPTVSNCTDITSIFKDLDPVNGRPGLYIATDSLPKNAQVFCGSNGSTYAVKVTLSGNQYWCVDNKGTSKSYPGTPTSSYLCS